MGCTWNWENILMQNATQKFAICIKMWIELCIKLLKYKKIVSIEKMFKLPILIVFHNF